MTRDRHLSEDRLLEWYRLQQSGDADDPVRTAVVRAHLGACERCARRYSELSSFLETVHEQGTTEADGYFTESRLTAQYERIMRRVDHLGRPGQVISFPLARRIAPAEPADHGTRRWIAAAAVASLLIGFTAGRLVTEDWQPAVARVASVAHVPVPAATTAAVQRPQAATVDDSFVSFDLSEIDLANDNDRSSILQSYDALTPTVQEVSISPR